MLRGAGCPVRCRRDEGGVRRRACALQVRPAGGVAVRVHAARRGGRAGGQRHVWGCRVWRGGCARVGVPGAGGRRACLRVEVRAGVDGAMAG